MSSTARCQDGRSFAGERVAFVGRLSGMPRRDAQRLIGARGGIGLEALDATATLIVVAEGQSSSISLESLCRELGIDDATSAALRRANIPLIGETDLWQRLGLVESDQSIQRLYTPAMLADLLKVDVALVRRWQRRGFIRPARRVHNLAYFDFPQVVVARRLANLMACGVSPSELERRLVEWRRPQAGRGRSVVDALVVSAGRRLLRQHGGDFIDADGQQWFSFVAPNAAHSGSTEVAQQPSILPLGTVQASTPVSPELLLEMAQELEDQDEPAQAADMYRAALAAGGPTPQTCFALAEALYRMGDLSGARERYSMAVELDENYVEARVNLGCILAQQGRLDLAEAAFEGALRYHADYADAHYHLARLLHESDRQSQALPHWRAFARLAPDSPWAIEARLLLELAGEQSQ